MSSGGFDACDDIIDEFTVAASSQTSLISSDSSTSEGDIAASNEPFIARLENGASEAGPAACSPAALASLTGRFLPNGSAPRTERSGHATTLAGVRVLINGSYAPILSVSPDRVSFLCPSVPPSTSIEIAAETAAGLSNRVESQVEEASPGIVNIVESTTGLTDTLSIRATGIDWLAKFPSVSLLVRIGTHYVPIESVTPDPQESGVSTLTVILPSDISGDSIPVVIEVVQTDGRSVTSNPASIMLATRQRAVSYPSSRQ